MSDHTVGWRRARKGREYSEFIKIYLLKEHYDRIPRELKNLHFESNFLTMIEDNGMFLTETCHICAQHMAPIANFTNANSPCALAEIS
jgi:hypothetical protein